MTFRLPANSRLRRDLGTAGSDFLEYGLAAIDRILPHTVTSDWRIRAGTAATRIRWVDSKRRGLRVRLALSVQHSYSVEGVVQRRKVPEGVGSIPRTLDLKERDICSQIAGKLTGMLKADSDQGRESLSALRASFDERVVAAHLAGEFGLTMDLGRLFARLRRLAESTYENRALSLGCLIDAEETDEPAHGQVFPEDFLDRKRYRALSDGYHTAYRISRAGRLVGFEALPSSGGPSAHAYFPEWCRDLASASTGKRVGVTLTTQGDLLVFHAENIRFTYRFGQWQYWNHAHLVDLLRNAARVQRVPKNVIPRVVRAVYRAALDISFRRTGGLFVLLRNRQTLRDLVRPGDALADDKRHARDSAFDSALPTRSLQLLPRSVTAELAALDGAVVLSNKGEILAYGAVLEPKRRGKIAAAEGSRTKAAIGASNYGVAVKISSDGDITVYVAGREFIHLGAARGPRSRLL